MNILITGGVGYFGQAMTRYLLEAGVAEKVAIYSRGEAAQARMRDELQSDHLRFLIGDVRDQDRLERAMHRVDLVIHAAALKRVEVGEYNPSEMVRTNVDGTMAVIRACQRQNVGRLVVLSSDKACAPLNAYGATKLVAEKLALAAHAEAPHSTSINVTRYGNVAGSTGSIIPMWRERIAQGKPLEITSLGATRFWMTVSEAVDLVWFAANTTGGNLIVPSLPAYDVQTLAEAMCPRALDTKIVGLRPGEKMHESMINDQEARGFSRIAGYWVKGPHSDDGFLESRQADLSSNTARRMDRQELVKALGRVK